jgi:hypothetical protein
MYDIPYATIGQTIIILRVAQFFKESQVFAHLPIRLEMRNQMQLINLPAEQEYWADVSILPEFPNVNKLALRAAHPQNWTKLVLLRISAHALGEYGINFPDVDSQEFNFKALPIYSAS